MTEKFQNKYRIPSVRAPFWDYGWNAAYFVTICTKNRKNFFGDINDGEMNLSAIGLIAEKYWHEIPIHFPFVELSEFVVMPNHVHGIVVINKKNVIESVETGQCPVSTNNINYTKIAQNRFRNQGKHTLSSIIGSYKSAVTKNARIIDVNFTWQSRFHDHIIRNDESFWRISEYIKNNPRNWEKDDYHNR